MTHDRHGYPGTTTGDINNKNYAGSLFFDRTKPRGVAPTRTDQIYHMSEHVRDPNHGSLRLFFLRLEDQIYYHSYRARYYYNYLRGRMEQTGWTIVFAVLFLFFVYLLCFVEESKRISNDSAKMGAFLMALFLVLSSAQNSKVFRQLQEKRLEKERGDTR